MTKQHYQAQTYKAQSSVGYLVKRSHSLCVDAFEPVLKEALDTPGPVIVEVPVDYSDNHTLSTPVQRDLSALRSTQETD